MRANRCFQPSSARHAVIASTRPAASENRFMTRPTGSVTETGVPGFVGKGGGLLQRVDCRLELPRKVVKRGRVLERISLGVTVPTRIEAPAGRVVERIRY
jgi:hypothetical protein